MPKPRETRSSVSCAVPGCSALRASDAVGDPALQSETNMAQKDPLPRMRVPSAAFEGLVVVDEREVWEVDGIGEEGADDGLGLVEPDSPIPRFQLFPLFPLGPSGPLASPHVLLRSSYPSLSVIGSGGWLARGSWTPFVVLSLCLFDCRGCCIDERHGKTTDTHPNSGAFPRLTRFDGG